MMAVYLVYGVPLALVWVAITGRVALDSLLIGYLLGLVVIVAARPTPRRISLIKLPGQLLALVIYVLTLLWDIFVSSVEVARIVLTPSLPLKPGIIAVHTQDATNEPVVAALSADAITLTPGELVVEIKMLEGEDVLYVHSLNAEKTALTASAAQWRRLNLLNRILGRGT